MTVGSLSVIITILSGLAAGVKWLSNYFGDSAVLRRLLLSIERQKGRAEVEKERLLRAYDRIDHDPDKTGQELLDDVNRKLDGKE